MFKIKSIVVEQPRSPDGGTIQGNPMTLCDSHPADLIRREFLQVGFRGFLGFGLADLLAGRALAEGVAAAKPSGATAGTRPRARSMILVFLTDGLSHLDSLDMKPDAPEGIRGKFRPIATRVPGIQVCEHLPGLAARAEKLAIVRSLSHTYTNHLNATHELLIGHAQPGAFFDKTASRDDYPCYAAGLDTIRPRGDGIPSGVTLPTFLMEGPLVWPASTPAFWDRGTIPGRFARIPTDRDSVSTACRYPRGSPFREWKAGRRCSNSFRPSAMLLTAGPHASAIR